MRAVLGAISITLATAGLAVANTPCGGPFSSWVEGVKAEAMAKGHDRATVDAFFKGAQVDQKVLGADRSQTMFQRTFTEFSRNLISTQRLTKAQQLGRQHKALFDRAERDYGIPRGILLSFWAFETDFGAFQGNFNTVNALVTLAHDCRRPGLFRPQVLAALELFKRGQLNPARQTGAWAGEIGMVQMLPADILARAVDGDGDGKIDLMTSVPDAILSGARMLQDHGWRGGQPWLHEVTVPADLDWSKTGPHQTLSVADWQARGVKGRNGALGPSGMQASVLLPQGRKGPAFLAYPNFQTLFEWNKSSVYVLTAAYFATRVEGAPAFAPGKPDEGLTIEQVKDLQRRLQGRGHDVGNVDGIIGAKTREAVQKEQARLGLPADAWPTRDFLNRL
jgi:lytic murein transglycosylase